VGNDVNDLECLRWVGVPIAVADAQPEVLAAVKWVTSKPGGRGAVREVTDEILAARRRRAPAVRTEEV
jgi:N-acylneuraminate cytidylyltransferase